MPRPEGRGTKEAIVTQERSQWSGMSGASMEQPQDDQDMPQKVQVKASDYASKAQEKASEYGNKLQGQADAGIDRAAEGLEQAAEQMRTRIDGQGGIEAQVGTKLADGLERSAGYLREHEADEIWHDVEQFVKDHPLQAAATAAFAGFVVARIMK